MFNYNCDDLEFTFYWRFCSIIGNVSTDTIHEYLKR